MSDSEEENYAKYGCPLDPLDEGSSKLYFPYFY